MGTKLNTYSEMKNDPLINVTGEKGKFLVGKVVSRKTIKSSFKDKDGNDQFREIYNIAVEDTDMDTVIKDEGSKDYKPCDIEPGQTVTVFAPTRLNNALKQTVDGDRVKIVYLGKGKATKFGGKPHDFEVEKL